LNSYTNIYYILILIAGQIQELREWSGTSSVRHERHHCSTGLSPHTGLEWEQQ